VVVVRNSRFWHNTGSSGGAIWADRVDVVGSDFWDNQASNGNFGGAIAAINARVRDSSFRGNQAPQGGAIISGNLNVANSTFVGNEATAYGGAIRAESLMHLDGVTMFGNTAPVAAHIDATVRGSTIRRSVLTGAIGPSCRGGVAIRRFQSYASESGCGSGTGNLTGPGPLFGPLTRAANRTWIYNPRPDAIILDAVTDCTGLVRDQRGVSRPQGEACDMGATERLG
jgi:predicted outer membrane repeat protein